MSDNDIAKVKDASIKKGDVVFIKFKDIGTIYEAYKEKSNKRLYEIVSELDLDSNTSAMLMGGYFYVESVCGSKNLPRVDHNMKHDDRPDEILILNHINNGNYFRINETMIEEIRVEHDVAVKYFSEKFQLSMLLIDDSLIINGELVDKDDKDLISMLEKTVADIAIKNMLDVEFEG